MYALFLYGRGLEAASALAFYPAYFLSAYAGNVLSFLLTRILRWAPHGNFRPAAAEGMFVFQNRQLFGNRAGRALMNVLYVAGINLLIGFSSMVWWIILGISGAPGRVLFTWFGGPRWKMEGFYPAIRLVDEREGHGSLAGAPPYCCFSFR